MQKKDLFYFIAALHAFASIKTHAFPQFVNNTTGNSKTVIPNRLYISLSNRNSFRPSFLLANPSLFHIKKTGFNTIETGYRKYKKPIRLNICTHKIIECKCCTLAKE